MIVTYGLDIKPHRGESRPRIALIKTYLLTYLPLFITKCFFKDLLKGFNMYLHISYEKCPPSLAYLASLRSKVINHEKRNI